MCIMAAITLENLADNVLKDPESDPTAKLIALMAKHMAESLAAQNSSLSYIEGAVRRVDRKQDALVDELEKAHVTGETPDFSRVRQAAFDSRNGSGEYRF